MSKQSDAKTAQGYEPKPVPPTCGNCRNIKTERELPKWMVGGKHWDGRAFTVEIDGVEKNLRCTLGGFAVKKMATCNQFAPKIAVV